MRRLRFAPFVLAALTLAISGTGCTRRWFREQADREVNDILGSKDVYAFWKINDSHVYPDGRARFADPTNPDRPPMPPDDPAARALSPNPQRPGRAGIARIEGTGYIDMLAAWDAQNRTEPSLVSILKQTAEPPLIQLASFQAPAQEQVELPAPRAVESTPKKYLLTMEQAVELAVVNSREFQNRREDLYLFALPVTYERFGLGAQAFLNETAFLERTGVNNGGAGERWRTSGSAGFGKVFTTGALLLFAYANQTVVNLAGAATQTTTSVSTANLDIVQPLLRGGSRAVALEPLTQAERNLLYEIRSFARFRKEYFQYVSGGANMSTAPTPTILNVPLIPGAVATGTTGNVATVQQPPGSATRLDLSTATIPLSQGFLPTVLAQSFIGIEKQNVKRLEEILRLFEGYEAGGDVSSLQVGQVQIQLLQGRSNVLQKEQAFRDNLDVFKLQLGVPLNTPIDLEDSSVQPLLRQFQEFEASIKQFEDAMKVVDALETREKPAVLRGELRKILTDSPLARLTRVFKAQVLGRWDRWSRTKVDDKDLARSLSELRKERNRLLDVKAEKEQKEQPFTSEEKAKLKATEAEIGVAALETALRRFESAPWKFLAQEKTKTEEHLARFRDVRNAFADVLGEGSAERLELARMQWPPLAPLVLNGVDVVEGDLETVYEAVTRHAHANRLDLMNARAQLVDQWRQVRTHANALMGVVNVGYHMDSATPPTAAQPLAFTPEYTRHQLVLNFQVPLVRMAERNAYRAQLIAYQRARRTLMFLEDSIADQVRVDVRALQVAAKNYKINQQAVELAFLQVESSLETFRAPPQPNAGGNNAANAAALTQQLLTAYARLPNVEETLLTIWINYRIARQQLYLDLELMPLDSRGVWIDEFADATPFAQPR